MGQSPSVASGRDSFYGILSPSASALVPSKETDRDYTDEIPDELLAYIFQFLGSGDRKRCSLVCRRWLRVDGQSRHRLSLNAEASILESVPSIFSRFNSVTKLTLGCDRRTTSLNDEALVAISLRCSNLTRLKLRGCREITDEGMTAFAQNCRSLRKLSCGSCNFGSKALNSVFEYCQNLEEISMKRLRGIQDGIEPIRPGAAGKSLRSVCLKELINGQSFEPLLVGSKKLKSLKIIRCLGDWDNVLEQMGKNNENKNQESLMEIHLERIQVSDMGLSAISKCSNLETLHIVKTPECSNLGLVRVAEKCRLLRKLHIDGWRTNRIGDEGLVAVAKHCPNLLELVLIGVHATHLSLTAVASKCSKLERLALCGSGSIGDPEIACIAEKCISLKKLCIKGCPISDIGIEAIARGCPNLIKIKLKKCRGVSSEGKEWLQGLRRSMIINMDTCDTDGGFDASGTEGGANETGVEYPTVVSHGNVGDASTSSNARIGLLRTKLGIFSGRNLVACRFRR